MTRHAAIYARISDDRDGESLGVERQIDDCRALARRLGLTVDGDRHEYVDNSISASTRSTKPRPAYAAMLDAVRAGEVQAIVAYSNSRLTRRPRELEDLITLYEVTGVTVHTVVSGEDDLSTADGRMVARIKANVDAAEAERAGERIKRQKAQRRAQGWPDGGRYRPFGYNRDWTEHQTEGAVVRDVFQRYLQGGSINGIATALRDAGVTKGAEVDPITGKPTSTGSPIGYQDVRLMLERSIYAGLMPGDGAPTHEDVARLVSAEDYADVQRRRKAEGGNVGRSNARAHALSGLLICAACGHKMRAQKTRGVVHYRCNRQEAGACGKVSIPGEHLDTLVSDYVKARLYVEATRGVEPVADQAAEAARVQAEIDAVDNQIKETRAAMVSRALSVADATPVLAGLNAEIARLRGQHEALAASRARRTVFDQVGDYEDAPAERRHAEIKRHISAILVSKADKPGKRSDGSVRRRLSVELTTGEQITGRELYLRGMTITRNQFADETGPESADAVRPPA